MKYKMIVMDMDGTLLTDDKRITERSKSVLKKAADMGVKIVISTGRIFASARFFGELLGVNAPIIASNGAYIREMDKGEDEVIYAKIMGKENIRMVLDLSHKYGLYSHFYTWNSLFSEKLIYSSVNYSKWNRLMPEDMKIKVNIIDRDKWEDVIKEYGDRILKAVMMDDDGEKIQAMRRDVSKYDVEITSSYEKNFEVMSKGVSKGAAVSTIARLYNIDKSEIICVGDSENDIPMIEYAGLGIAMKNGIDEIKDKADFITLSNEEDGVAYAIEKFVLNQ
jgi:HAD-superfamily hydrolase, subfamily IIB